MNESGVTNEQNTSNEQMMGAPIQADTLFGVPNQAVPQPFNQPAVQPYGQPEGMSQSVPQMPGQKYAQPFAQPQSGQSFVQPQQAQPFEQAYAQPFEQPIFEQQPFVQQPAFEMQPTFEQPAQQMQPTFEQQPTFQDQPVQQAQTFAQQPMQQAPAPQMEFPQQSFPQAEFTQQVFTEQPLPQAEFPQQSFVEQPLPQVDFPQAGLPQQTFSQAGFPQAGLPQQSFLQAQFSQADFSQQQLSQQPMPQVDASFQPPEFAMPEFGAQVEPQQAGIAAVAEQANVAPVGVAPMEASPAVMAAPVAPMEASPAVMAAPVAPMEASPAVMAAPVAPAAFAAVATPAEVASVTPATAPAAAAPAPANAPDEPNRAMSSFYHANVSADEAAISEVDEDDDDDDIDDDSTRVFMQNRELSWLTFNERVLDQGADESVPLLERLNFISIFWSNLQEFFMVRVGSLTDLSFIEPPVADSKTGMTPKEQIQAIHERCRELYPIQESYYEHVRGSLAKEGVRHLRPDDLSDEQRNYLSGFVTYNVMPFLSPQIINPRHPFPHLENGKLYILVRLEDEAELEEQRSKKKDKKGKKVKKTKGGAEGVVLGLIPLPHQCDRIIKLPGRGFQFILLEHAIEMFASETFSMYSIKHTNVICVTRNADIDANQTGDEQDEDYREYMRRLLKQRARLAPVRLECERPLSPVMEKHLLKKLGLKRSQVYDTIVPLDLSFTWGLGSYLTDKKREKLSNPPFTPAWPVAFDRNRRIMDQVGEHEVLLSYPYESMDPFVQLLKEAAIDPNVVSIKITLYRLASQSQLAEALIAAAENGKNVTALFELRARFDESNNIEWSQRFEQAGCNVIYGFRDYKVHSKICCITRQTPEGLQHITQLGTGNYNEKTAKLYTDLSFITTSEAFGRDATEFFRNMQLENVSDNYEILRVAPLQIKPMILDNLDRQIELARQGKPCGAFLKANSVTDKDVIEKIAEASQAGVGVTLFVRGICCIVPEVKGWTDNVRVVSIVGRLLEHSRIYCFGTPDDCVMYLSSADLMTRNLNKRVEIAWPILSEQIRWRILDYIDICLRDTAKLRELRPNKTYTPLGAFCELDEEGNPQPAFDAQAALIARAAAAAKEAAVEAAANEVHEGPQESQASVPVPGEAPVQVGEASVQVGEAPVKMPAAGQLSVQSEQQFAQALEAELQQFAQPVVPAEAQMAVEPAQFAQPTMQPEAQPTFVGQAIEPAQFAQPTMQPEAQPMLQSTIQPMVQPEMQPVVAEQAAEFAPATQQYGQAAQEIGENLTEMRLEDILMPTASEVQLEAAAPATVDASAQETAAFQQPGQFQQPQQFQQPGQFQQPELFQQPQQFQQPGQFQQPELFQQPQQQPMPDQAPVSAAMPEASVAQPALTEMSLDEIMMPQAAPQEAQVPGQVEPMSVVAGDETPLRVFIGDDSQGSDSEGDGAPLRVFLGDEGQPAMQVQQPATAQQPAMEQQPAMAQQPGMVQQPGVDPAVTTQLPPQAVQGQQLGAMQQPGMMQQPGEMQQPGMSQQPGMAQQPGVPQQPAGTNQGDFFGEGNRPLEMPPQKKGFFSRFKRK